VTILEVIQRSTEFLAGKGVESPRLQAELLLAQRLSCPRMELYLRSERALSPADLEALREWVRRRGQREPLQQILGSTSFCGLELAVNCHVLVPRPETELLAERAWRFLQQLPARALEEGPSAPAALDFGTGSGCLAVALAVHCPAARVWAVDVSGEALELARQNAARHGVADRVVFVHGDGFGALPPEARFDLVVSNPPYIPTAEIAGLDPEVRDHEPHLALDGGPDGLAYYRRLAAEAGDCLRPAGRLMAELGDGQAAPAGGLFAAQNWIVEAVEDDYTQRPRILVARRDASPGTPPVVVSSARICEHGQSVD
jgi:release factor glutamine methyltransferase